ncbi:MAG: DHHA1 domain-containing protein, partial [Angelakisella sp.]
LLALMQVSGVVPETITGEQISFALAPRINVTGRIASVDLAVELLLCQDSAEAQKLAEKINSLNNERKEIEADIVADIGKLIADRPEITAARVLVVCGNDWHPGVIGITAARLVERYRKPCIILTDMQDGELRGSARSVEGYSIIEAIHACEACLIKYGGHPMAAGLSLSADKLEKFRTELEQYSEKNYPSMPRLCLSVNDDISIGDITLDHIHADDGLQPYGCGNPQPIPVLRGMTLAGITPMGNGKHLRLTLTFGGARLEAVYFGIGTEGFPMPIGTVVDCAVSLSVNSYKGVDRPSARILSIVPTDFPMEDKLHGVELYDSFRRGETFSQDDSTQNIFSRVELSAVFKLLRELSPYGGGADWLFYKLGKAFGYFRVMVALDILTELKLVSAERQNGNTVYTVLPSSGKASIPDAITYKKLASKGMVTA